MLLREALETLGAGAKTAVGYGQFVPQAAADQETGNRAATAAPTAQPRGRASWVGREAIANRERARVIEDHGDRLLVRYDDDTTEEVGRNEVRLR
jgi:hypothetical protein